MAKTERHFCDRECKGKHWRAHCKARGPSARLVRLICAQCGSAFFRKKSAVEKIVRSHGQPRRRSFCRKECYGAWISANNHGPSHPRWVGGSVEYRGPNWRRQNRAARERDGHQCKRCGDTANLQVHHMIPFRSFGYVVGENDFYRLANELSNLITLCQTCHVHVEMQEGGVYDRASRIAS
jgi:5-methylcytosine-specific restriction endonuclease McrA